MQTDEIVTKRETQRNCRKSATQNMEMRIDKQKMLRLEKCSKMPQNPTHQVVSARFVGTLLALRLFYLMVADSTVI
jgi:hypothetical protein